MYGVTSEVIFLKAHYCQCQGLDHLDGLSKLSCRNQENILEQKRCQLEFQAWGVSVTCLVRNYFVPTTSHWIERWQPKNIFQSFPWLHVFNSSVCLSCLVYLTWMLFNVSRGCCSEAPTSTLGGTDDPNRTSREFRGWLQQKVTPGTMSSSKPFQRMTF